MSGAGPVSATFGVTFSNLSIINIRQEFEQYLSLLHDPQFRASLLHMPGPVELPGLTWLGLPHHALTYMLRHAILGMEACVNAAVNEEAHVRQMMTPEISAYLSDPFSAPGRRGTAEAFYNNLPSLLDPRHALRCVDEALWARTRLFYKEVRNPLFHGYQLYHASADEVIPLFGLLADVYVWMDSWWQAFPMMRLNNRYLQRPPDEA
jgi:hypothetical protein